MAPGKRLRTNSYSGDQMIVQPTWQSIFNAYPIFDGICSYLEPRDIIALQKTTKQLARPLESLFQTQWNINGRLNRFVGDPVGLRSQMGRCDALISGSFALQFFDRVVWNDFDLDIYVQGPRLNPGSTKLDGMARYLIYEEGYHWIKRKI